MEPGSILSRPRLVALEWSWPPRTNHWWKHTKTLGRRGRRARLSSSPWKELAPSDPKRFPSCICASHIRLSLRVSFLGERECKSPLSAPPVLKEHCITTLSSPPPRPVRPSFQYLATETVSSRWTHRLARGISPHRCFLCH